MGPVYSDLAAEKKTWSDHSIKYDKRVREINLKYINSFEDGKEIYLCHRPIQIGGLTFQHWFVTDKNLFFEFHSPDSQIYSARVHIMSVGPSEYVIPDKCVKPMDNEVRDRMRHVVGMSNYSLSLRNCEHVANYVFRGRWISSQMNETGILMEFFEKKIIPDVRRQVNSFPSSIRPHIFQGGKGKKIYSFLNEHYTASHMDYYLDWMEDTYNILVVGPTGAGKSHLINVFFNQPVCDSNVSHRSVTKEITFIRGQGEILEFGSKASRKREIVVADTVGLCDTDWEDDKIIEMIKGRISSNIKTIDAVFIVFPAGRLSKEHVNSIKLIMKWLDYHKGDRYLNFLFVGTHAENLSEQKKLQLSKEVTEIFSLKTVTGGSEGQNESLVYVGFPPEDSLNDKGKKEVLHSLELLQPLLLHPGKAEKIPNPENAVVTLGYWKRMKRFKQSITLPSANSCAIL